MPTPNRQRVAILGVSPAGFTLSRVHATPLNDSFGRVEISDALSPFWARSTPGRRVGHNPGLLILLWPHRTGGAARSLVTLTIHYILGLSYYMNGVEECHLLINTISKRTPRSHVAPGIPQNGLFGLSRHYRKLRCARSP